MAWVMLLFSPSLDRPITHPTPHPHALDITPTDIQKSFVLARRRGSPRAFVLAPSQTHWPKGFYQKAFNESTTTKV